MLREAKTPALHTELFQRHSANPILTAQDWPYPAHTVFNAGACQAGQETVLLVRVEDRRGHSHLTVARSSDGGRLPVSVGPGLARPGGPLPGPAPQRRVDLRPRNAL